MKKLWFLFILFFSCKGYAQLNTGIAAGYDTYGRAIAAWTVGCTIKQFIEIQAEIRPSMSRNVFAHNYMGGRIGLDLVNPDEDFLSIIAGAGYFYDLKSQDKKSLNKYYWGTFVKSIIMITDNGGLSFEALYLNSSAQFSVGIHFVFTRHDRL